MASFFLIRSRRSTLILALMVLFAVGILVFLSSLAVGVTDAMIQNTVSLYSGHITGFEIPADIAAGRLVVPGVAQVLKRSRLAGMLEREGRSERIEMTLVDPDAEKQRTAVWKKMTEGRFPQKGEPAICLGYLLAQRLGIRTGETLTFRPESDPAQPHRLRVAGIFKSGLDLLDREQVFCSAGALASAPAAWDAAIFLEQGMTPETVIAAYARIFPGIDRFRSWDQLMPDLRELIDLNYLSMSLVMVLVFAVVALGISCAFVIFILKNVREYGIMKAMGVTATETATLIGLEVVLLNMAAATLGVMLGIAVVFYVGQTGIDLTAFTSHNRYFSVSGIIYPRLTAYSLWLPPALAFVFSLVGAIWPVVLVARKKAAEILRII
jgi:ABC-type lipoprotein release transport system permease subunit